MYDKDIIDAIVAEYTYRLKNLEKTIAELRVKTDTMEMRISQQPASQTPIITSTSVTTDLGKEASQHQSQVGYPPTSSVSETGAIIRCRRYLRLRAMEMYITTLWIIYLNC